MQQIIFTFLLISFEVVIATAILCFIEHSNKINFKFYTMKILWLFIAIRLLIPIQLLLPQGNTPSSMSFLQKTILGKSYGVSINATWLERLTLLDVICIVWGIGAIVSFGYYISKHYIMQKELLRWSVIVNDNEIINAYNKIGKQMRLKTLPRLVQSNYVKTPMLIGILKPKIILPVGDYTTEQIAMILEHELAHQKQKDIVGKLIILVAMSLHWFNPLIYLVSFYYHDNMEKNCDEYVLKLQEQPKAIIYGKTILKVIQSGYGQKTMLATCLYADKSSIVRRFEAIVKPQKKKTGWILSFLIIAVLIMSTTIFGFSSLASELTPIERNEQISQYIKMQF